jgi:peptidoglycan/LPS O-acetylase OafA/YrhL
LGAFAIPTKYEEFSDRCGADDGGGTDTSGLGGAEYTLAAPGSARLHRRLSYALYIIHYPIIALFNNLTVGLAPLDNLISAGLLSLGAAHVLDYWLQPQVKALFKIGSSIRP